MNVDLFGNEIVKDILLRDKYVEPPFTRLDAVSGSWQKRKNLWNQKGIKSELGRPEGVLSGGKPKKGLFSIDDPNYKSIDGYTGISIFDPVLCELMYKWFCPDGGKILDPFAGGSVRGIVANFLGFNYTGLELRPEQVESNRQQGLDILPITNQPQWYEGDSDVLLNDKWNFDFDMIFSCPPYMDLEVYSDRPDDLSTLNDADFTLKYESIIKKSCDKLKKDGFAIFVVGDVRDKKTGYYKDLITITKMAFYKAGLKLYNEAILLESGLNTAAMRADKQFTAGKKLVKVHQNVLIFKKP